MRNKPYAEKQCPGTIAQTTPRPWRPFRTAYCLSGLEILLAVALGVSAALFRASHGPKPVLPVWLVSFAEVPAVAGVVAPATAVLLIAVKHYQRSRPERGAVRDILTCALWSLLGQVAAGATYIILNEIIGGAVYAAMHAGPLMGEGTALWTLASGTFMFAAAAISFVPCMMGAWIGRFATGVSAKDAAGRPRFGAAALGSAAAVGSLVAGYILGHSHPYKTRPLPPVLFLALSLPVVLGCCWACAAGMWVCVLRSRLGADGGKHFPLRLLAALVVLALVACATLAYAVAIGPFMG